MVKGKNLVSMYADHQRLQGLSAETVRRRTTSLRKFERHIEPLDIGSGTLALVEDWLGTFAVATTRRAYRSDLASFYRWAVKRKLAAHNPVDDTDRVRVPRRLPRPIDRDLVADLILLAPDRETSLAIAIAAYAGLRRSEIANLERSDLSLESSPPTLLVRNGKGGKDRMVPVHPALGRMLAGCPFGKVCPSKAQAIGKKVAAHMRAMGVDGTIHQLRHTFGTEAYRSGRDLLVVAELMGHTSTTTTVGYTKLAGFRTAETVASMYGAAG